MIILLISVGKESTLIATQAYARSVLKVAASAIHHLFALVATAQGTTSKGTRALVVTKTVCTAQALLISVIRVYEGIIYQQTSKNVFPAMRVARAARVLFLRTAPIATYVMAI